MKAKGCGLRQWLRASQDVLGAPVAVVLSLAASVGVVTAERQSETSAAAAYVKCGEGADAEHGGRGPLQRAIDVSRPGAFIQVSGTCPENVTIPLGKDGITLDGGGTTEITAPDPTQPAVLIRAKDITVRAFTITGGRGGVIITRGGTGVVDGNIIRDSGFYGVSASQLSSAVIVNNTIENHQQAGIGVAETAYAFIGFVLPTDTVASPNFIRGNRAQGIAVFRGSYARIVGNDDQRQRSKRSERAGVLLRPDF